MVDIKGAIPTMVGIVVLAVIVLLVLNKVWVGGEFDPSRFTEEDIKPIFKWVVAGLVVLFAAAAINKFRNPIKSPAEFFTVIIATIILYFLLTAFLPALGVIEKPAFILQSMIP